MALKMLVCALSVNMFARYYETHFHNKMVKDKQTKTKMVGVGIYQRK
jgi:hypothetical protein